MKLLNTLKNYLFPKISPEVQRDIDEESVRNIRHVSGLIAFFECLVLCTFLLDVRRFDHAIWVSFGSVLFCVVACCCGFLIARRILKRQVFHHPSVLAFKAIYFLAMSYWGIMVSERHYVAGEQMLTFFTVELLMVCFIIFKPWVSAVLMTLVYACMYAAAWHFDGAVRIHRINYFAFLIVSVVGMIVRFHSQMKASEKKIALQASNKRLEFVSRHDGLTNLRNRIALEEDAAIAVDRQITAYMIDINGFKQINDTYGHYAGDAILQAVGAQLKKLLPNCRYYRYGGDEFLVLGEGDPAYTDIAYRFLYSGSDGFSLEVVLCIGYAQGRPSGRDDLFSLIKQADRELYKAKELTRDTI